MILCDWETAICGPMGRDAGTFTSFPTVWALFSAFASSDLGASVCSFMDDDLDMFHVSEEMKMEWMDDDRNSKKGLNKIKLAMFMSRNVSYHNICQLCQLKGQVNAPTVA